MRAGRLARRITLLRQTETQGPDGAPIRTWSEVAKVWAELVPVGGRERLQAPQTIAERTARIRIRWRSDVDEQMRIRHDGRLWEIQGIAEIGRREGLELTAAALQGQGG